MHVAVTEAIKKGIGKLNPFGKQEPAAATKKGTALSSSSAQQAETTIRRHPEQPVATTTMTREELRTRRLARVENASNLVEGLHIKVMLRFLDMLCLIGPFWILVFTTSEDGQLFTGKPFNIHSQTSINLYATALFGECILAGLTFLWQYANAYRHTLDHDSTEYQSLSRWILGMACTWMLFAAISALGQFVYLRGIWHPADDYGYLLIAGRVTLYTAGDWACAKYLGWRVTTLRKIAQEEKAKGEIYEELERQEASRIQKEAEADMHLRQIQIQIESAERSARISNEVQEIMSKSAVRFLGQFTSTVDAVMNNVLENVNERLQLPDVDGQVKRLDEPDTGDL
jgi:hypothetical protein